MADGQVIIETKIDTSGLESGAKTVKSTVEGLSSGMKTAKSASDALDNSVGNLGKSLSTLSTIAKSSVIVKLASLAGKVLGNIADETSIVTEKMKAASTLFQGVAVDEENLLTQLYAISAETGQSMETLGQAVYEALSSSVEPTEDMANVLNVVSSSAKLAKAGFTDAETALSATLTVINAYKMDLSELDNVQSMLLETQNEGVTTVGELGQALANVTPTASSFGVAFKDIAAAVSLMTKQGTKTRVATTALAQVISELGKNGTTAADNLKEAAEDAGLAQTSFTDLIDAGYSLGEILELMNKYAASNGKSMIDMFSSIEAGRATLQLVGDNAEDYNDILRDMETASGLVQQSFEKTVDPTERLSAAWTNLFSKIGNNLRPTIETFSGFLADVIEKMTGQEVSSDDLSSSLTDLKTATENAKKAQEEFNTSINAATTSSYYEAQSTLYKVVEKTADNYKKAEKQLESYQKKLNSASAVEQANLANVEEAMEQSGLSYKELYDKFIEYEKFGLNLSSLFAKGTETHKEILIESVGNYHNAQEEAKAAQDQVEAWQEEVDSYITKLAQLVSDGAITTETIALYSEALAKKVTESMKKSTEAVESNTDAVNENADATKEALSQEDKDYEAAVEAINKLIDKYNELKDSTDALGNARYSEEEWLEDLNDLYLESIDLYGEDSKACKMLREEIEKIKNALGTDIVAQWNTMEKAFGEGLKDLAKTAAQTLGSSLEEFIYQLGTLDSQLEEIDKKISETAQEQAENLDDITAKEAALADAKAKGNAAAIKQAQAALEKSKAQKTALEAERAALEENRKQTADWSNAWKSAGKVALESLASVLESLGAELAAQAVIKAVAGQWATAAIATAGSVAAYVGAAFAKSEAAKYEHGGIVGGNSRHGDKILARVNSGELILNTAQQDNLARIIEAAAALAQSGASGAGIHVHFDGVSFYGLDEPAVGKAIYDNLATLKYEGVI